MGLRGVRGRAAVVAFLATTLISCSDDHPASVPPADTFTRPAEHGGWASTACPAGATCAVYSGLPTIVVLPEHASGKVVLVDGGGPGLSLQTVTDHVGELGLPKGVGLVAVGEHWEVAPPSGECLDREARRIQALPKKTATRACDLESYGFDAKKYRSAVNKVVEANSVNLIGAVGISFGAVRMASALPAKVPLLLLTPAPLPSNSLDAVANERATGTVRRAGRMCGERSSCHEILTDVAAGQDSPGNYNKVLGLLAAAGQPDEFETAVQSLPLSGHSDYWVRLAFAATLRYGQGSILPNMFSYRAGTCSAYGAPQGSVSPNSLAKAYEAVLNCPTRARTEMPIHGRRLGCVVYAKNDLVAPRKLAETWSRISGLQISRHEATAHGVIDAETRRVISGIPTSLRECS